jgi:hypothetical protein
MNQEMVMRKLMSALLGLFLMTSAVVYAADCCPDGPCCKHGCCKNQK